MSPTHRSTTRRAGATRFRIAALAGVLSSSLFPVAAQADAVIEWNATYDAAAPSYGGPPQRAYLGVLVQVAVHDALNAIDRRYETYAPTAPAPAHASPDAAIAAAARDVLVDKLGCLPTPPPARAAACANIATRYAADLAAIPDGPAKSAGIATGQAAAQSILALRHNDGSATWNLPYTLAPGKGVHQPTPPNFPAPANAGYAQLRPFTMISTTQFRAVPGELFNLRSLAYTLDYNLVKHVGNLHVRASRPDSAETDIARFWPSGGANWSLVGRTIVAGRGLDRWQHARLFALMTLAEVDGTIQTFDAKYTYNFWRPITAIRWADDGNPLTKADPGWMPLFSFSGPFATPPYPDYTCALPTASGANTEVLRRFFGTDKVPYTLTVNAAELSSPALPGIVIPQKSITRSYARLSQAAQESALSRVLAGIHFYEGCLLGVHYGEKVGKQAFQRYLRPVR